MKWQTMWWGMQIQAETPAEKAFLIELYGKLSYPEETYDEGTITVMEQNDIRDYEGFNDLGEMTLEFKR